MGILKSREEQLPVTCAVLKDEERDHFFAAARKKVGGNMERLARVCGVPVSTVADWTNGKTNIPYNTLQRLAHELEIELPAVNELRREYQTVVQTPAPRMRPDPAPASQKEPPRRERKERSRPRKERSKPQAKAEKPKASHPRPPRPPRREKRAPEHRQPAKAAASTSPKPSDKLAYWTAVLFAAARYEDTTVLMSANERMGRDFALIWADLTEEIFGIKPSLSMPEDLSVQEAALPVAGLEEFFARLEFKPGAAPGSAPGAPRWAWSNPGWKTAFLKGLVDASADFNVAPSLNLLGLSPRLQQSAQKILTSLGFSPKTGPEQALAIEGLEQVQKYFNSIGSSNAKLKDLLTAALGQAPEAPAAPEAKKAAPAVPREEEEEDLSVGPGNELRPKPPSDPAEEEDLSVGPGNELHPKPQPKPPSNRRRRTAYRGRPKR